MVSFFHSFNWEHLDLYRRVKAALDGLAIHFSTETYIEGISATEINLMLS
jgi:hypothetical protein